MDQAPVVAPPLTLEPERVMAEGVADWQTAIGSPATAVGPLVVMVTGVV